MSSKSSYYRRLKKEICETISSKESSTDTPCLPNNFNSVNFASINSNDILHMNDDASSRFEEMEFEVNYFSDQSFSSESCDDELQSNVCEPEKTISESLREWAIETKASHASINNLLEKLKFHHPNLPRDSRTLLKTNPLKTCLTTSKLQNGDMIYYGLINVLKEKLANATLPDRPRVFFTISIDGIPISKSTNEQFWPILGKFDCLQDPFLIGLFCGNGKPAPIDDYLKLLAHDLKLLKEDPIIEIESKSVHITLKGIICDAVGRAFIKGIAAHNSRYGCEKCKVKGEYHEHTICFLDVNVENRCNNDFLLFHQSVNEDIFDDSVKLHIKRSSPLVGIVDLVDDFPLEYMHLICLGVMKRLLRFLTKRIPSKLSSGSLHEVNQRLHIVSEQFPSDFSRKPRSLVFVDRFKATECRMFLLYTGPIVLKKTLSRKSYEHFLLLHYSIKQLTQPQSLTSGQLDFIQECLLSFIHYGKTLYGKMFLSYNVHSISHLVDEYKRYGPLDNFSAFCFETYLGSLKRMLRSHHKPLSQMKNRIGENLTIANHKSSVDEHLGRHDKAKNCYYSCLLKGVKVRAHSRDDGFFDVHGNMFIFKYAQKYNNKVFLHGRMVDKYDDLYTYPSVSRDNGIIVIKSFIKDIQSLDSKLVAGKCAIIKIDGLRICCKLNISQKVQ